MKITQRRGEKAPKLRKLETITRETKKREVTSGKNGNGNSENRNSIEMKKKMRKKIRKKPGSKTEGKLDNKGTRAARNKKELDNNK